MHMTSRANGHHRFWDMDVSLYLSWNWVEAIIFPLPWVKSKLLTASRAA
jgi:hypothetical protein